MATSGIEALDLGQVRFSQVRSGQVRFIRLIRFGRLG
jgi:hypothetical protein